MRALTPLLLSAGLFLQAQPVVWQFSLPNGLRVVHLEDHGHPMVRAILHVDIAATDTPAGRQGLARCLLGMLQHSDAALLKSEAFDRLLEDSGIRLAVTLRNDGLVWRVSARSRDQDKAMALLADRVLRTLFTPTILEAQQLACWRDVEGMELPPSPRLEQALVRDPATQPSLAGLSALSVEDLQAFRDRVLRPDRAVLVLHGDLGLEQAKRLVLLHLGTWTPTSHPQPFPAGPVPTGEPNAPASLRISTPGAGGRIQAWFARPANTSPEVAALLDILLPVPQGTAPIRLEVRRRGLLATLEAGAETPAPQALAHLRQTLAALRLRGYTQQDLDLARAAWRAGRSRESLHPGTLMEASLEVALGQGVHPDRMAEVSLAALNTGLRAWLAPDQRRTGALGDPAWWKDLPTP